MTASPITRAAVLDEAKRIITRDRNAQYGEPEDLFPAILTIWDGIDQARGNRQRGPEDVALYMMGLKIARAAVNPARTDTWIDVAGYSGCGAELASRAAIKGAMQEWADMVCASTDGAPDTCLTCGGATAIWSDASHKWLSCPACTRRAAE